ncbi:M23 family metallopeptidase [Paenibacillus koleovorans]|uniref:M23 family metallopeptidase n=1 Tax=Paenibacillus koleovorans TaxID=121608 RepID=UPI0013E32730|nr:M23 family metallopeptidase [Paenibacillus koleovorans]
MKKMRLKWLGTRLTFMVIADANSKVVRFRLPVWTFLAAGLGLSLLIYFTMSFYNGQIRTTDQKEKLEGELSTQNLKYTLTVSEKNETIEHLQNDLIRLSQQADEVKAKIAELKKLEDEMKSLTGGVAMDSSSSVVIASAAPGVGGESRSVTNADMDGLVHNMESDFANLGAEMTGLFGSLTQTKQLVVEAQHQLAITPTIWPVSSRLISSGFGTRVDPFTFLPSFHNGIDIAGKLNDPVWATADGKVVSVGWDSTGGNNIIIEHTSELRTRYMHLNKFSVSKGDIVKKGQQIGLMGSTGRSTGYHVHYGVIKNGVTIDPRPYLKASRKED